MASEGGLHLGDFAGREGERFTLDAADGRMLDAVLAGVAQGASSSPRNEQFTLTFRAPVDAPLEQRVYTLTHPELGRLEIFLVPMGRDAAGVEYEAVFNLLIAAGGGA